MNLSWAGALACLLLVAACSPAGTSSSSAATGGRHAWTHPGELRIAVQQEPVTLNPVLAATTTDGLLNRLSFDPLVSVEPDGKTLVPVLAAAVPTTSNGGISRDGLTIRYRLRHGVTWQDGAPFTSADVKFSWQAMMNAANNVSARVGYDDVRAVDTPDAWTVVFHLIAPFAPFVTTVFSESDDPVAIVPAHLLAHEKNLNEIPFNSLPIGTGAFRVVRWVHGDHIELAANPHYFRGRPKLNTIIVRDIPDENTSLNSLRTHDVDWLFEPSPNLYNVLRTIPQTTIVFEDQPQTLRLRMNLRHPPLDDIRVRQAVAFAVDKRALVDRLTGGSARVAGADQPPFSWAYRANVTAYPPSIERAKALLRAAGYVEGADGLMHKGKGGPPLTLELSTNSSNATRRLVETQLQAMLHAVGIDAPIKNYPGNLFFATYGQGGIVATGRFDLAVSGWIAGIDPDDHALYACDQFPPVGANDDRYCSPAMDAAQRAALSTYDLARRRPAYFTAQELIARDIPGIIIWYARNPQAINPDFHGFAPNPVSEAWNAYQWEI
jgi:peptide/nickel transport system substrate-binding protein